MTMQIRVAKTGKNAKTSTDPNDFIFHSDYNTFKIISQGTLTSQTVNADPTTFSVAHNQSATPTVFAFAIMAADDVISLPREVSYAGELQRYWELDVDDANIYFVFYKGASANYTANIQYFVFEAPLDI